MLHFVLFAVLWCNLDGDDKGINVGGAEIEAPNYVGLREVGTAGFVDSVTGWERSKDDTESLVPTTV